MTKKLFVVDAIATFRNRYVIEAESLEHAYDEVTMVDSGLPDDLFEPVTQRFLGETISDGREVTREEFNNMLEEYKKDKKESCSFWMGDKLIRAINYDR
jgi:hypothetical protein